MVNRFLGYGFKWVLVILIQLLLLNDLSLHGYVRPFVYPFLILMLPAETSLWIVLCTSFLLGLVVDLDFNTPGMHASALTLLAFLRPVVLSAIAPQGGYPKDIMLNVQNFGFTWYLKYAGILVLIHHLYYFFILFFSTSQVVEILLSALLSSIVSLVLIVILELILNSHIKQLR